MFGAATMGLLGALLILSFLTRQPPLFLLTLALLLATGLSRLWERYCLVGLGYRRSFSKRVAEFGDTVDLEIEVVNRKLLPLAWLEVEDELPRALAPARGKVTASHRAGRSILRNLLALRPFERVRRHYPIVCMTRGEHVFGPARLRTGDLFGFITRESDPETVDTLVVYPRVVPITSLGLPAHQPLGNLKVASWLFEDPSRLAGVREYRPRDSLRRIHWAASARSQRLQVKIYEPTTTHRFVIFLNLHTTADWWGFSYDSDALELAITAAASLATWALAEGYQVGVETNGMHRYGSRFVRVPSAGDPEHASRILDALGRLQPFAVHAFATTIQEGARRLPYGATVVAVTAALTPEMTAELIALRRRGYPVAAVLTGPAAAPDSLDGIVIRRVGPPEVWRTASEISLGARS